LHEAIHAVHDAPFPTIAMVNGPCLGAGFELAMACDLRTAAAGAPMGLPEVKVGAPSVIEAALLPALVGPGRSAEMLLTGESVTAEQALAWGLVNRVAPAAELEALTTGLIDKILACAPSAIRLQKELMVRWRNTDLPSAVRFGINAFAQNYASGEGREAALAFLEKRPPQFESAPCSAPSRSISGIRSFTTRRRTCSCSARSGSWRFTGLSDAPAGRSPRRWWGRPTIARSACCSSGSGAGTATP
jgi:1,4-dihydroxy-2-naphthoyl-CoA synthase